MHMDWHLLYPENTQPTLDDITNYIGESKDLWMSLLSFFESKNIKPKLTYSKCGMKPGWNVKFQKSGQSFGTFYPQKNAFDVMIIIGYKLDSEMEMMLPFLSEQAADKYRKAGDYMKMGKWMMLRIDNMQTLDDYFKIAALKLPSE